MILTEAPVVFITLTNKGTLAVIKADSARRRIYADPTGAEYICDFNIGAKIRPCSLRDIVRNDWINLTPLPYEVILRDNYALGIYLVNNGVKVDSEIQQFPLQTDKFILFTLPIELQRTLSQRAAVKAAVEYMNRLPTARDEETISVEGDPIENPK